MSAGRLLFLVCIAAAAFACAACSSNGAKHADLVNAKPESRDGGALLETECEAQLLHLASRMEAIGPRLALSGAAAIKLKELHSMSEELFLKREYALALTLIEEALQLIEEIGD